jgi:5-methyltetrahydrofolate--homocysteine methyltransferase
MQSVLDRVRRGDVLVGDGAMGTMLMERGLGVGECPERFNLDRPEVVEEVARLYAEAGADIVSTNTFGGSALNLEQYGLGDRTEEVNRQAVHAARRGAAGRAYVAVSCGPCGRILQPYGDTPAASVASSFRRQLEAALSAGPDLVCVETMIDLEEARLAIQAVRECDLEIPLVATMTFDATPRGFFTVMGVTVEKAVAGLTDAGADIIGSNCGNGIDRLVEIAE